MNKNLKKVISSTVALALSLSSVAALAASYTDVAATANYAAAVNNLSALGIVNGYDDGTFKPDNKITRAEVTKMVVGAKAQMSAAESAKGQTKFTDVPASHWAAGFINVGSAASGFINGMGDGTFAPESNVTYAQIVKMLVCAIGYGDMGVQYGGYPTGYLTVADNYGVTAGLSGINANDEVTREQVARLIDNAINTPLLVSTTWSPTNPEFEIKDGNGADYETLLTEKHNAYKVEGKVIATSMTDPNAYEKDEVLFSVESARNFDDEYIVRKDENPSEIVVKVGDTDAINQLFNYSSALIKKNDDDTYTLLSINASGKTSTASLVAGGFDTDNYSDSADAADKIVNSKEDLRYYTTTAKTGTVKKYKLANVSDQGNAVKMYVNGVEVTFNEENVETYIVNNKVGNVTLIDAPQGAKSSTDGYYDYILATYYKTGVVDSVSTASKGRVTLSYNEAGMASFDLNDEEVAEDNLQYSITLDGKEIKKSDIQQDDVISVAYDVTGKFADSSFFNILVSRTVKEGKVTGFDEDDGYAVGGENYKYYTNEETTIKNGTEYKMLIDVFGRIAYYEELASANKYAIVDNAYVSADGETQTIKVILPDGTVKALTAKTDDIYAQAREIVFNDNGTKKSIADRVVTYKSTSDGKVNGLTSKTASTANDEFDADYNKIKSVKLNSSVQILDAQEYNKTKSSNDIKTASLSTLVDGSNYEVLAFDRADDSTFRFVIILNGEADYTDETQTAVFYRSGTGTTATDEDCATMTVLYNGESKVFNMDPDVYESNGDSDIAALAAGNVIVFKTNTDGEIEDFQVIFGENLGTDYAAFAAHVFANADDNFDAFLNPVAYWIGGSNTDPDSECEVVFGVVTDKTTKSMQVAALAENTDKDGNVILSTNLDDADQVNDITIGSTTKVYVYDYNETTLKNRLTVGDLSSIVKTSVPASTKLYDQAGNRSIVDWEAQMDNGNNPNFAFVRMVDDVAQEVFIIIAAE